MKTCETSSIRAIILDMDGLMFDTETAYTKVQEVMSRRRGKEFTIEVKRTLMGRKADEVMSRLNDWWGKGEHVDDLLREQDEALVAEFQRSVEVLPGLDSLLATLRDRGIRRCIGTSSRMFLVEVLLEKHRLQDAFEFVVSGDMVQNGKPHPDIYLACLSKLAVPCGECLVLEDSLNGVRAGNAAGCVTCAIPSVYTQDEDFSEATFVCSSLSDPAILNFFACG
jgi:HAD superfamily hydrolase (TIGR01509 family)